MPTYALDLKIPKATPEDSPVERRLKIKEGVVTRWIVLIPAGHHSLARMRVLYGLEPLLPAHANAWIRGEDESLAVDEFWDPAEQPYELTFQGWNEDDTYDHTFYVRVVVLPRHVAAAHQQFIRRLGREIGEAFLRATGWV